VEIVRDGIRVNRGRPGTDFGPGFYATADAAQAGHWTVALTRRFAEPTVVLRAELDRDLLASLDGLYFVRGHEGAEDYWSFVHHCRLGATTHARGDPKKDMYDVVVGPVSRNYMRRAAYDDMDQISFHTPDAQAILNTVSWSRYDTAR
jgi:hypothetical protein